MSRESSRITESEIKAVLKAVQANFSIVTDNSTLLMKNLAVFNQTNKDFSENLFNKNERLSALTADSLNSKYEESFPFVFVLCSTANYAKCAKEFTRNGWIHITSKNGAWYTLKEYRSANAGNTPAGGDTSATDLMISASRFIEENRSQLSSFTLNNGIGVTVKHSPKTSGAAVALAVDGGELLFADKNPGLSSVLINTLAYVIQWKLNSAFEDGKLSSAPSVSAWTGAQYSLLTINCSACDIDLCLKTAGECIVFGDISPALADSISYDLRSQWKIKCGTPEFQLLCEGIRMIYEKPFTDLYNDTKDRPAQMEFTDIAAAYPLILDSSRFSLVITGGVLPDESLKASLENSFGLLSSVKASQSISSKVKKLPLPHKAKKVQLRHLFFTDVSADKAGPRPLVLIPTTDFSDPLLYLTESPDICSTDSALFNALLYLTGERLQSKVSAEQTVKVTAPDSDLPYAQIAVTKIKHTAQTDSLYEQTVSEITQELEELINSKAEGVKELKKDELLQQLEDLWVLRELEKTSTNEGTAFLIQKGISAGNAAAFLDLYTAVSRAQAEDYYLIYKSYFSSVPPLRLYSSDSKK